MHLKTLEPRRFWKHTRKMHALLADLPVRCSSCGDYSEEGEWQQQWVCQNCLCESRTSTADDALFY